MREQAYAPPAELLAPLTHDPLVLVDIGARGGLQPRWRPLIDHLTWIGFEPDARSAETIAANELPARRHVLPTLLAGRRGTVAFHRSRDAGDSSILEPNMAFLRQFANADRFEVIDTIEVQADTLDAQLQTLAIQRVDFIKLDTQGSEFDILEGSEQTLRAGVLGVEVEVEFSQLYSGQPLFADVDAQLRRFGLQLVELMPRRWPYLTRQPLITARGPVVWAEAFYFKPVPLVVQDMLAMESSRQRAHLAKACAMALVHGFPDFAAALMDAVEECVEPGIREPLVRAVEEWDAHGQMPIMQWPLDLTPAQVRALRKIERDTGVKPTTQLRRAVRTWIKSQESD